MRNLKRALSLALASIMVLGLMVVGSSAAESYTDVTDTHNVEAIEVLQSVDPAVMEGTGDNKFEPEKQLTRNEMAVIMCRLLDYTVASYKGTSPFTDVPAGHWAEEYVAACYTNGIIAGYSSTYFGGDDIVTTGQAALMIEKALGYFQEQGDFGSDWLVEAVRVGSQAKLFDGIKAGARDALDRNNAAKMCLNALEADMVEVSGHDLAQGANGQLTTKAVYTSRTAPSGETKYSKINNDRDTDNGNRQIIQLGEELYDGNLRKDGGERDAFGRPATKWSFKSDEIGTYVKNSWLVGSWTAKASKKDIYEAVGKGVYDDLTKASPDASLFNCVNGVETVIFDDADTIKNNYINKNDTGKVNNSGNGTLTEVYVNTANSNTYIVTIDTWVFQAAGDYSASREAIDLVIAGDTDISLTDRTLEVDDFPQIADFKADDYVLVTGVKESATSNRLEVKTVQKAEVVTGEVSGYAYEDSVTMDGTTYKYSNTANNSSSEPVKRTQYTVGQDASVVLDAYGYIIAVDEAVVSDNYVFVSEFAQPAGLSNGEIRASAFFTDGTTKTITVVKRNGEDSKTAIMGGTFGITPVKGGDAKFVAPAGWYTYSVNSAGEYTLYAPENKYQDLKTANTNSATGVNVNADSDVQATSWTYSSGTPQVMSNDKVNFIGGTPATGSTVTWNRSGTPGTSARANDKTIVLVHNLDKEETDLYVGAKNIPDIKLLSGTKDTVTTKVYMNVLANKTTNFADYVYVEVCGDVTVSGGSDSGMVYVTAYDLRHTGADNDVYYTYKVLDEDAKQTTITADSGFLGTGNSTYTGTAGHTVDQTDASKNLIGAKAIYRAFYKGRTNSDDQYTSLNAIPQAEDGRFVSSQHAADANHTSGDLITSGRIDYEAGSLVFTGTGSGSWNKSYTANSDAKVVLVTLKTAAKALNLNLDKDTDYKAELTSAKSLGDRLKNYSLTYSYQAKLVEKQGATIEEIYVTVHQAKYINPAGVSATPSVTISGAKNYAKDAAAQPLTATVSNASTFDSLSYQWQVSTTSATTGFANISGATSSTYTPSTSVVDEFWYRCVVTGVEGNKDATDGTSTGVKVEITASAPKVQFTDAVEQTAVNAENLDLTDTTKGNEITGTTMTLNIVDGDLGKSINTLLGNYGYTMQGNAKRNNGGDGYDITAVKDGVEYTIELADSGLETWYPVTVDNVVKGYIKDDTAATVAVAAPAGDTTSKGYVANTAAAQTTFTYATYGNATVAMGTAAVTIETGYVAITKPTLTETGKWDASQSLAVSVNSGRWNGSSQDFAKVGAELSVVWTSGGTTAINDTTHTMTASTTDLKSITPSRTELGTANLSTGVFTGANGVTLQATDTVTFTWDVAQGGTYSLETKTS